MPVEKVLFSIHGVRTDKNRGPLWQDHIDPSFEHIANFTHEPHSYRYFEFWEAGFEKPRNEVIEEFSTWYDSWWQKTKVVPSVIGHSFGSYVASVALLRFTAIRYDRLILCGSIVDQDYDWSAMLEAGRVREVLNERAGDDWVVKLFRTGLLRSQIPHSGPSGLDGFHQKHPRLQERDNPLFKHSDHFVLRSHCDRFWRPFIFGNVEFAALCDAARQGDTAARRALRHLCEPLLIEVLDLLLPGERSPAFLAHLLKVMADEGAAGIQPARDLAMSIVSAYYLEKAKWL
ncbi:MAG: hypothetical protein AABO58_13925 [Acidobacteriota bacterium]